jgi:hypothetical protein
MSFSTEKGQTRVCEDGESAATMTELVAAGYTQSNAANTLAGMHGERRAAAAFLKAYQRKIRAVEEA